MDIARAEGHDRIVAIVLEREFQSSQPEEVYCCVTIFYDMYFRFNTTKTKTT